MDQVASPWMTPAEVAHAFGVDPKTVTRWAHVGRLKARVRIIRTPGGHRRYRRTDIEALLAEPADAD